MKELIPFINWAVFVSSALMFVAGTIIGKNCTPQSDFPLAGAVVMCLGVLMMVIIMVAVSSLIPA